MEERRQKERKRERVTKKEERTSTYVLAFC